MTITLYFINWNDSFYLPFIKEWYWFCNRIVMYDNHSTDNSVELAKSLGFEVRRFGFPNTLDDQQYLNVKNECWKECKSGPYKSDYVIVCDADEFVKPVELSGPVPLMKGYDMFSTLLPEKSVREISTGIESESYAKQAIFSPAHVDEIYYNHGCHTNNMTPKIPTSGHAELYHYRCIGGWQRLIERHKIYAQRMSKFNRKYRLGHHYLEAESEQGRLQKVANFYENLIKSKPLW